MRHIVNRCGLLALLHNDTVPGSDNPRVEDRSTPRLEDWLGVACFVEIWRKSRNIRKADMKGWAKWIQYEDVNGAVVIFFQFRFRDGMS